MKSNKLILSNLIVAITLLFVACNKEEGIEFSTENTIGFLSSQIVASGAETDELTVDLISNGFADGNATVVIRSLSDWEYGTDYITIPTANNGEIVVDIIGGKGSFTFGNKRGVIEGEEYFSISVISASNFNIADGVASTAILQISTAQKEDFNGCSLGIPSTWTVFSSSSNADFGCSDSGRGASGNTDDFAIEIDNFGADAAADDWLVSPIMLIGTNSTMEFNSLFRYTGSTVQVMISTDYSGSGDPSIATWTEITEATNALDTDTGSWDFVNSGLIEIGQYAGVGYIGFHYTSIGTGSGESATFRLDDFVIR